MEYLGFVCTTWGIILSTKSTQAVMEFPILSDIHFVDLLVVYLTILLPQLINYNILVLLRKGLLTVTRFFLNVIPSSYRGIVFPG